MQRIVGYTAAVVASGVGWKIGGLVGPIGAYFGALVLAAATLWLTRRWLRELLG
ncbi:MAG TPA: hypothetical protein PLL30_01695 [Candidatus Krumholzibacteria bacterium]|nr:hypothetical protein [Candidatus Krumholzibacteria bacterium]HPD70478.1 hypothetical protein [Candidatus Krumholzibacteria bacterium]HRY39822.1 hypothetical protein [Candidatus Krumholzibacteria bacterium]